MTTTTPTITLRQVLESSPSAAPPAARRAHRAARPRPRGRRSSPPTSPTNDAWERLNAFREELAAQYPNATDR